VSASAGAAISSATGAFAGLAAFMTLAARFVAASASATVAFFGESGSRTSSITAMGALSPLRLPILVMRV
jgi:hypothetical protein